MRHVTTALKALGAVAVLGIVGNSVSVAATGQGLVLGKSNKAATPTAIQRTTAGPVLTIRTKKTTDAPFTVNGRGWIRNLNADTLDGMDSSVFTRASTTAVLSGRVDAVEATANGAANQARTAQTGVDAIAPQLPIAQAMIELDGTVHAGSRGISSSTYNSVMRRYEIGLTKAPNYSTFAYVAQATPIDDCRIRVGDVNGKLIVSAGQPTVTTLGQCRFVLTVTPLS